MKTVKKWLKKICGVALAGVMLVSAASLGHIKGFLSHLLSFFFGKI